MDISFKGIQNVGAMTYRLKGSSEVVDRIAFQLTGHDASNFADIFQKFGEKTKNNFVRLDFIRNTANKECNFAINGRKFDVNEDNFEIIGKISRILKRISEGKEEIALKQDYLNDGDSIDNLSESLPKNRFINWLLERLDDAVDLRMFESDNNYRDFIKREIINVKQAHESHRAKAYALDANTRLVEAAFSSVA